MLTSCSLPRRPLVVLGWSVMGFLIAASGCSAHPDDAVPTRSGLITTSDQHLLVPAYIYSHDDTGLWDQATPTQTNGTYSIFVISGPVSGRGFAQPPASYDSDLAAHVANLRAHGAIVLGYVTWNPQLNRSAADIKADFDQWANPSLQLGLRGVFIDDAERSDESILAQTEYLGNYGQDLFADTSCMGPCPGRVVFNWGGVAPEMEKYVDCQLLYANDALYARNSFQWVTYEGTEDNYLWTTDWHDAARNWVHNYASWRFVNLVYGDWYNGACVSDPGCTPDLLQASGTANAGFVYMTDHWGPSPCTTDSDCPGGTCNVQTNTCIENTWERVAKDPLWTSEQSAVSGYQNAFEGTGQWNEVYAYSVGQCPAPSM